MGSTVASELRKNEFMELFVVVPKGVLSIHMEESNARLSDHVSKTRQKNEMFRLAHPYASDHPIPDLCYLRGVSIRRQEMGWRNRG
jgi:hypothetical protein